MFFLFVCLFLPWLFIGLPVRKSSTLDDPPLSVPASESLCFCESFQVCYTLNMFVDFDAKRIRNTFLQTGSLKKIPTKQTF